MSTPSSDEILKNLKKTISHTNEGYHGSLRAVMGAKIASKLFLSAANIDEDLVPEGWRISVERKGAGNFPNQKTYLVRKDGDAKPYGFKIFYNEGNFQISGFSPKKDINEYINDGLIAYFNAWAEKNEMQERIIHNPDEIEMSTTNGQMRCGYEINVDSLRTFLARVGKFSSTNLQRKESVSRGLMVYIPFEQVCEGMTYEEFAERMREESEMGRDEERLGSNKKTMSFRFSSNGTIHFYWLPKEPRRVMINSLRFIADLIYAFFDFSRN